MRPFTQSFVLAHQPPYKYYVYSNIFRYKDILGDDVLEIKSNRSDNDDAQLKQRHSDSISPQVVISTFLFKYIII